MKKYLLIIIPIVILSALAGYFFLGKSDIRYSREVSLYKAVPVSSPVFVELESLHAVPLKNEILKELAAIDDIKWLLSTCERIDTLIRHNRDVQNSFAKRTLLVAFDLVGENMSTPMIITQMRSSGELASLEVFFSRLLDTPVSAFISRKYHGHKITTVPASKNSPEMSFAAVGGLVMISPQVILVEKGIRQLNSGSLLDNSDFVKVSKTVTSHSDIAWFINHKRFPEMASQLLNTRRQTLTNEFGETKNQSPYSVFRSFANYAAWSELDMDLSDTKISANGISIASDSLNNFLSVFAGQEPVSLNAGKILPANTVFYTAFSFSEKERFFERLDAFYKRSGSFYEREEGLKKMERGFGIEFKTTFESLIKSQAIVAYTSVSEANKQAGSLFLFNLESRKEAQSKLKEMIGYYANRQQKELSDFVSDYQATGDNFRIYRFPFPSLPSLWLGEAFEGARPVCAACFDDYLVFAGSEKTLQTYLDNLSSGALLNASGAYRSVASDMESRSNLEAWLDVTRGFEWNELLFSTVARKKIEANAESLRRFDAVSWQVICEKDLFFNSLQASFENQKESESGASWQIDLGAGISRKPQIVKNHTNPGASDVLVQDDGNTLHLVSETGVKIWSIPIAGKIMGEIFQIDYFRNGKLQFLFNTREKLYLIDRNGNNVAGFPIILQSPATNSVSVFDYDNNRKYRYFVASENRKVYAYEQDGKILSGWDFDRTQSEVSTPVQHFRVAGKDYIVFKDRSRVYIQDRRGNNRVNVSALFENSKNPVVLNLDVTPKIVVTDTKGTVYCLFFDGRYTVKEVGSFSADHLFTVSDLNGDKISEFVFVDENKLVVIDENGKKLYDEKFSHSISEEPGIYMFSKQETMVGVVDQKENEIYLFRPDGKQYKGFPMKGSSPFSIGALTSGQMSVVVGDSKGRLSNYPLN